MKKFLCLILITVLTAALFAGCAEAPDVPTSSDAPNIPAPMEWAKGLKNAKEESAAAAMNDISFDTKLFDFIAGKTDGNFMISPLSFRYALGLLLEGAEGETKAELLTALGVKSTDEWAKYCADFNGFSASYDETFRKELDLFRAEKEKGWIAADAEEPIRALRVANSVWKRDDLGEEFKPAFRERVSARYAAEYETFTPSDAVKRINAWANEKTEGMIPRLLNDGYDTSDLAVVLMNALYFKDNWVNDFPEHATKQGTFTAANGKKTEKTFMTQTADLYYYADGDTQLVILPMEGDVFMTFVLGSTDRIDEKISQAARHRVTVTVTVPQIDLESSFDNREFIDFLKEQGVEKAFTDSADFSAMLDTPTYVDDIIQKTKIKLDEKGVEAAAVTAILEKCGAMPETDDPFVFTADRPFSFYIHTSCGDTTAVLFAGKIVE